MAILEVKNVKKVYTARLGSVKVQALNDVSFSVEEGEYVAIMGESGSGKTTLLNILASLDRATSGQVLLRGQNLSQIKHREICAFRREHLGFIFQDFNLLDTLSLKDNIFLPMVLSGQDHTEMEKRIVPLAKQLAIADILEKYPYEVSGGQKQRAAACRALITNPDIILADEPTGALDSRASKKMLSLFEEINKEGQTILMVTHSIQAASYAGRVLFIKDGSVFHQIYRGEQSKETMYKMISDTLTVLQTENSEEAVADKGYADGADGARTLLKADSAQSLGIAGL
ncbi:MAG: ABC transporter ATP-binding protein [Lachnospiraceae bacterium]|nr:ABC transporter ATP-binding protein [Lachnospiraceae bacterium]